MKVIKPNDFRDSPIKFEIPEDEGKRKLNLLSQYALDKSTWLTRSAQVREGILKAARLWPLPERAPLSPIIRDRKQGPGYTVENVAFESSPGFFCTGNLYRPLSLDSSVPAVLSPHGHFAKEGGRFSAMVQTRCSELAQMGIITFAYDMVGWGESLQVSHTDDNVLAYQLWNSIRSLDFVLSLEAVDSSRVGITGASGGGTQCFLVAAVDERIRLSVPVVMVSAHYYGGCHCETGMPIHKATGTNNVEIAALAAPRPQLLISVGIDFTKNTHLVEFPYLQKIYSLFGKTSLIENVHLRNGKHDYGPIKRTAMYQFIARHFSLPLTEDAYPPQISGQESVVVFSEKELRIFRENDHDRFFRPMHEVLEKELLIK